MDREHIGLQIELLFMKRLIEFICNTQSEKTKKRYMRSKKEKLNLLM